ncbi:MAG TPA: transporter [Pirellulales bacterium]|nr:transporter [Pirellulales bacterium]
MGSAGEPNSGAFDAPDTWRPYWESPNIVVEEADEYPRPRSLEVDDPNSFWYTNRPNILNVPIPDEWDFYNIINTDRPDFTDAVYSVGKGVTYLETGYTFHKIDDGPTHISTRQLPESLLRYGLTNEFELRLKWNGYLMTDYKDYSQNIHLTQFGGEDLDAGFKWELIQQQGWRPMFTVVSGILIPTGTGGVSANAVQPHFNLLWGWGLRRWLYLKVQTGCDFLKVSNSPVSVVGSVVPGFEIERTSQASWHQSCCILTQWTKRVGAFHEWFLIQNTGSGDTRAQNFLDMGTYLYLTPNIQFDARIGKRISNRVDDVFTGVGFSARW